MERIDKIKGTFDMKNEGVERPVVSPTVVKRLPRYHRYLGELLRENRLRISSSELSNMMNVTASQIRQDLNCFGGFGQQGYGYNVKYLYNKISELLGVDEGFRAVIVGAGHLGSAIVSSHMFERRGVEVVALFDVAEDVVGKTIANLPVYHADELESFCAENNIAIAVLTTPKDATVGVAERLSKTSIRGIWNFSNMEMKVDNPNIIVQNMHMGDSLLLLTYDMHQARGE